jgi:DNA-binding NtrC family response regulator
MAQNRLLLAENDEDFVTIATEFLEGYGFEVITATDPIMAHRILLREQERIQVAVFDSRLVDDFDEYDESGIDLAKMFVMVPSIVMTRFPSAAGAVQALRPSVNGRSPAKDYVDKRDGLEVLLQAIQNILPPPSAAEIRDKLIAHFNEGELRDLCFRLNIDYDSLPAKSRQGKVRELILYCERHERLADLIAACRKERPLLFS